MPKIFLKLSAKLDSGKHYWSLVMIDETDNLETVLRKRLKKYDAIVIGEDTNTYLFGLIDLVQKVNSDLMLPIYVAKTTTQLINLKLQLDRDCIKILYLLDNRYKIEPNEPTGQELIELWNLEEHSVLITSSYLEILNDQPTYPVVNKVMPVFDYA